MLAGCRGAKTSTMTDAVVRPLITHNSSNIYPLVKPPFGVLITHLGLDLQVRSRGRFWGFHEDSKTCSAVCKDGLKNRCSGARNPNGVEPIFRTCKFGLTWVDMYELFYKLWWQIVSFNPCAAIRLLHHTTDIGLATDCSLQHSK